MKMKFLCKRVLWVVFLIFSGSFSLVFGADLFVTSAPVAGDCTQADPCRISSLHHHTNPNDTVYLSEGSHTNSGNFVYWVQKDLTFLGGWDGTLKSPVVRDTNKYVTVIDGENSRRGFFINPELNVTIDGLTIANCSYGLQSDYGAGLYDENATTLTLNEVTFFRNSIENASTNYVYGGGAYITGGTVNIVNSVFDGNSAGEAVRNSYGGALYIKDAKTTITDSTFINNGASTSSALYYDGYSAERSLVMKGNTIKDNGLAWDVSSQRGAFRMLDIYGKSVDFSGNLVQHNRAYSSRLISVTAPNIIFSGNTVLENRSKYSLISLSGAMSFQAVNNIIGDNGATSMDEFTVLLLNDSSGFVVHNTMVNNDSQIGMMLNNANVDMINNIISGYNTGITSKFGSSLNAQSTLWDNVIDTQDDGSGTITDNDRVSGDPQFVDVANNNYHIQSNSAAKDAGMSLTVNVDIDGDSRPMNQGHDIGADEFSDTTFSPGLLFYLLN